MSKTKTTAPNEERVTPIAALQAELDNFNSRKTALQARKAELQAAEAEARTKRVSALSGDGKADVTGLSKAIRESGDEVAAIDDALRDLASAIEATETRLKAAQDTSQREASATKLEGLSASLADHATTLQTAVDQLVNAAQSMIGAFPHDVALPEIGYHGRVDASTIEHSSSGPLHPVELVSAIVADALDLALPDAFRPVNPVSGWGGNSRALFRMADPDSLSFGSRNYLGAGASVAASLKAILLDRLETQAAKIRSGEVSPVLGEAPKPKPKAADEKRETGDVLVFCVRSFRFVADNGKAIIAPFKWTANVPIDQAAVAVELGLALRMDTDEGRAALAAEQAKRAANVWSSAAPIDPEWAIDLIAHMQGNEAALDEVYDDEFDEVDDDFEADEADETEIDDREAA